MVTTFLANFFNSKIRSQLRAQYDPGIAAHHFAQCRHQSCPGMDVFLQHAFVPLWRNLAAQCRANSLLSPLLMNTILPSIHHLKEIIDTKEYESFSSEKTAIT